MYEGVDTVVLFNELAFEDVLPVQWQPCPHPIDRFSLIGLDEANQLLLQACVAVEEHPPRDTYEELSPIDGAIARLDFKLNLVLQLLDKLGTKERLPPPTSVQFNALGATWAMHGSPPRVGDAGLLRVQLRSSLPQTLELPSEVTVVENNLVTVQFHDLSERIAGLIRRLAFLRHRRHIADVRKSRGA